MHLKSFNDEKRAKAVQEHETRYDSRLISREDTSRATTARSKHLMRLTLHYVCWIFQA